MNALASQQYDELARCLPLIFDTASQDGPPRSRIPNPESRVPEALQPWIGHLMELDSMAELLPAAGVRLSYEELRGLALLRAARQKFLSEHERCGTCGTVKRRDSCCLRGCQ